MASATRAGLRTARPPHPLGGLGGPWALEPNQGLRSATTAELYWVCLGGRCQRPNPWNMYVTWQGSVKVADLLILR